ncbi:uncharacterized protein [Venturia canescens]|uniref:uncharacterized protein n=1 Tax=Venturia canescens TaxID=32260 RepID=UPI001C9D1BE7|nr:uncharacterized protein LOC122414788 [Venturia canescens]XP_043282310.1 uncharacterized protein LOC122414788 [Venturia canescens]
MDFSISPVILLLMLQLLFVQEQQVGALKIRRLIVPTFTYSSKKAHLECRYDLESDTLYSVTWYKDNEEFYKYEPKARQNQISHPVEGVKLNHHASDGQKVILEDVNLQSRGVYKCDVIADASNFPSVQAEALMEVVVPPRTSPRITGEEKIYASGDILTLNCTSDKSYPAARLTWFINGQKVEPDSVITNEHDELLSTVSSLRLELGPHHLSAGRINVRCEAVVETSGSSSDKLKDLRDTQVFVQGHGSTMRPDVWGLLAAFLVNRIAHLALS